jgi:hypothetical protein
VPTLQALLTMLCRLACISPFISGTFKLCRALKLAALTAEPRAAE